MNSDFGSNSVFFVLELSTFHSQFRIWHSMDSTPKQKFATSMALAAAQIRLASELKRERMEKYGKADSNTKPFELDSSSIFPIESVANQARFQNTQLGLGNKIKHSSLFYKRGSQVWKYGEVTRAIPDYCRVGWREQDQTSLCVPIEKLKPGTSLMETVRQTMMTHYCHAEDRALAASVGERAEEEAWDGICTTGFSIDGIPMHQPQLQPIIPKDPSLILTRVPVHTKLDTNNNVREGGAQFRITYEVLGETVYGFGTTKEAAKRDGCLKTGSEIFH